MDVFLDLLITVVSVAALALYMWSALGHFSSEGMPSGAKLLSWLVLACAVLMFALLWTQPQPLWAQWLGLLLELASLLLFWAAIRASRQRQLRLAFDPGNPRSFVDIGPYRYVRHPFYVSYIILWGGWALATWSLWALVPFLIMVAVYITAARDEERKFGLTDMAGTYADYRHRVGFFFPRLGR
ncbi:MAG: isoprenylcysteine carboxylmethyltransferase family protein [Hyphomicrobiales bacterium]|nr:MAG: isoprenylcysteine carboxylmethyltransferase family protein [Hyphomicrobiales bacterium]